MLESLRTAHARGARIAGLCSGAFVLAADVRFVQVPTSGHFLPEEQPTAVIDAVTRLIG